TLGGTALPMGLALILVVDAQWALGHALGSVLVPAFLLGAALSLLTAFNTAALISERAEAPRHLLLRIAAFGVLRSWPLSLLNLAVMVIAVMGLTWQPLLCWVLASSLVLYVIWAGARWSLLPTVRPRASSPLTLQGSACGSGGADGGHGEGRASALGSLEAQPVDGPAPGRRQQRVVDLPPLQGTGAELRLPAQLGDRPGQGAHPQQAGRVLEGVAGDHVTEQNGRDVLVAAARLELPCVADPHRAG